MLELYFLRCHQSPCHIPYNDFSIVLSFTAAINMFCSRPFLCQRSMYLTNCKKKLIYIGEETDDKSVRGKKC